MPVRYKKFYKNIAPFLQKNDFFIHIGANDGVTNDPIYDFIEPFSLRGIAIEPVSSAFNELSKNHENFKGVVCVNAAICVGSHPEKIYQVRGDILTQYPTLSQISSSNRGQLIQTLQSFINGGFDVDTYKKVGCDPTIYMGENVESLVVEVENIQYMTFDELVERNCVDTIDFLNIDAEGADYEIFMSIDLQKWKPKVICIETVFFDEIHKSIALHKLAENKYTYAQKFDFYSDVFVRAQK